MPFDINAFRSKLVAGGARPSLFQVVMTPPAYIGLDVEQFAFMCKSAQLPGSNVGLVEVPYFGRRIKVAGERMFDDWTVSIINDESFDIRKAMEKWSTAIASHSTKNLALRGGGANSSPNSYVGKAVVEQMGKDGAVAQSYTFVNIWPIQVSPIELSWEATDQIEEFQVSFALDYFENADSTI